MLVLFYLIDIFIYLSIAKLCYLIIIKKQMGTETIKYEK
jgi:hypothetical protein